MTDWDLFFDAALASRGSARTIAATTGEPTTVADDLSVRLSMVRHPHVAAAEPSGSEGEARLYRSGRLTAARPAREWIPAGRALAPGEVVTLGAGLARGLAALHGAGLARSGSLTLDDVTIDDDGRPAWRLGQAHARTETNAADDVAALATVLRDLLADRTAPGPLTLVLLRAIDDDPRRRPTAAQFADALIAACAPAPLRWPLTDDAEEAHLDGGVDEHAAVDDHALVDTHAVNSALGATPPAEGRRPTLERHTDVRTRMLGAGLSETPRWPRHRETEVNVAPGAAAIRDTPRQAPWWRRTGWRVTAIVTLMLVALVGILRGVAADTRVASTPDPTQAQSSVTNEATPSAAPSLADAIVPSDTASPAIDPVAPNDTSSPTPSEDSTASSPSARAPALPWIDVLTNLDAQRVAAFTSADPATLLRADVAGSAALASDRAAVAALRSAGVVARGYAVNVVSAVEQARTPTSVVLAVVDRVGAYDLVDRAGRVRDHVAAQPPSQWKITMVSQGADAQWRLSSVASSQFGS